MKAETEQTHEEIAAPISGSTRYDFQASANQAFSHDSWVAS
jgi:hypothetical protein